MRYLVGRIHPTKTPKQIKQNETERGYHTLKAAATTKIKQNN